MTIPDLMSVPPDARDGDWLLEALQSAVALELATIPPYLSGMWSIIDKTHPVRQHLSEIVLQEMLHLGLACNMLSTLGGVPQIVSALPSYPGPLPGGVRPELRVWLAGFSRAMVRAVYMEIEYPENGPITFFLDETYPTIGAFYDAVLAAFQALPESAILNERQLIYPGLGGVGLFPITQVADAVYAITTIKEQGEGTSQSPSPSDDSTDRAHYYRFAEMYYGRGLIKQDGKWRYCGAPIDLPPAYPMAEVPAAGYPDQPQDFNNQFTDVMNLLQAAWETDGAAGQTCLAKAIRLMPSLSVPAQNLMKVALPTGGGNYGPDFRLVPGRVTTC